ncbi:MAG: RNA polymerase sigma factor [Candidatus Kapabacteria bacterium]|jgi:RNA polymerase sigma-70 factor (ECF subfamily)|nr:RNA polymerase sigma factor [Candidatus Kapabacteria bacterium]
MKKHSITTERMNTYSDEELFGILTDAANAEAAFAELYRRYGHRMYAYCVRVLGDVRQAEDVFQEAMLKFFRSGQEGTQVQNVGGYLMQTVRNLCLNRKRDTKITFSFEDYDVHVPSSSAAYEAGELAKLVASALELLDDEYREAVILREYDGFSYQDIAAITQTSEVNARTRVFRGKQQLRAILQPYFKDLLKHQ